MNNQEKLSHIVSRLSGEFTMAFILLCRETQWDKNRVKSMLLKIFSDDIDAILYGLDELEPLPADKLEAYIEFYRIKICPFVQEVSNLYE